MLSTLGNCQDSGVRPIDGMLVIMAVFGWCRLDVADTIDVIVKATGSFMLLNSFYKRSARLANVVIITVLAGYLIDGMAGILFRSRFFVSINPRRTKAFYAQ